MSPLIQNIIRFAIIMAVQILLLNNVELYDSTTVFGVSLFKPFFYLLFLLMLPANLPKIPTLIIAFITGWIMDSFSNTNGLHASACLILGLVRPQILGLFFQHQIKEMNKPITPSLSKMGFRNFIVYISFCLLAFIFYFYLVEFWSGKLNDIVKMFLKILSCLITSIILIVLSQVLFLDFDKSKKRRSK